MSHVAVMADNMGVTEEVTWVFVENQEGNSLGHFKLLGNPYQSFWQAEQLAQQLAWANGQEYETQEHPNEDVCGEMAYDIYGNPMECLVHWPCNNCIGVVVKAPKPPEGYAD
ncbi:MAG: hypothetical protein ABIE68_01690 [bacterium]